MSRYRIQRKDRRRALRTGRADSSQLSLPSRSSVKAAFTLIELLVVIAIMAILAAML